MRRGLACQISCGSIDSLQKMVVLMLLVFCLPSLGVAEEASEDAPQYLYVARFIEVKPENTAKWLKAVEDKQQEFNSNADSARWGTWRILTGPRSNLFVRGYRTTQSSFANPKHAIHGLAASWDVPEAAYWLEHVVPLQESSGNRQVWRPIEGLFSQGLPETVPAKFSQHRRWRMKPGMYQRLEANYKKLIAAFDAIGSPINFGIARLEDGGDFMIYAETTAYNDTADLPGVGAVKDAFEKTHGPGSWKEFLKEHNAVMQENAVVETETWVFLPELSNLTP